MVSPREIKSGKLLVLNNADYLSKLLSDKFNFNFSSPGLLGVDSVVGDSRPISVIP